MSKVLIICPSIRPERFKEFYTSLRNTTDADVIVKSKRGSITQFINECTKDLSYDYYHVTNDDFIYHTEGWVELFIDKLKKNNDWGVCYGNDLLMSERLPTTQFVSKKMIETIGWFQLPSLDHLCGDCVWYYIGHKINKLFYFKYVIIEHKHFMNNKSVMDDTYKNTNSPNMYNKDNRTFREWINKESDEVINRILSRINNEN